MVHSFALVISADGERLTCDGFSLIETVHFGSLEFITDCFDGLSLCPKGSNPGVVFVGTTHNGSSSLWAMIEDSTEEFYTASNGEGSSGIPVSWRHGTGASPAPVVTTPWMEDAPTTRAMTAVPLWTLAP
jgi:hypothetical protein